MSVTETAEMCIRDSLDDQVVLLDLELVAADADAELVQVRLAGEVGIDLLQDLVVLRGIVLVRPVDPERRRRGQGPRPFDVERSLLAGAARGGRRPPGHADRLDIRRGLTHPRVCLLYTSRCV